MQGNARNCSLPRVPDWPENWMPVIVRDPVHALKLSFMQGDEPEVDVLRRVSKRCHRKIADSDDDMEDSVPDLIDCDQVREKSDKKYEFEDEEPQDENSIFKNKMDKIIADLDAEYPTFLFSEAETSAQQALDVLPLLVLPSKEHSIGSASSAR